MKKNTTLQLLFAFILIGQFSFAQVDIVYKDLVWSDEFDNSGVVNSNNWFHQTQIPAGGSWFNNEVQHYTNRLDNSFVDNGNLNIIAKKESFTDGQFVTKQYTSARLNSKFAFTYGRVDIRAKAPNDSGTWPALWLLGKNVDEDGGFFDSNFGTTGWPACGELDIMEHGIFPDKPKNFIGSAIHTPSSNGNTVNKGGIQASDIAQNYHIYSMNWSPNQISFLLDDVVYYTYNPTVKNASTWPFDKDQYILLNIAMGGFAGTIPSNFVQASMEIDYIRIYQNTAIDTQAPTNFKATVGQVTGSSVELVLNADDDSGNMVYTIDYGNGLQTIYSPAGVQKSVIIPNLSQNTNYIFTVTASDLSGKPAENSPIVLNAKTSLKLECTGNDTQALPGQGSFTTGYKYAFETIGTDVKITFELLDTNKVGVVAFLWKESPFSEVQMTNVTGNIFTSTISGQTIGSNISYGVKFAFAGGQSVTKYFSYQVGKSCSLGVETASKLKQSFFPNPVENILYLRLLDDQNEITLTDVLGKKQTEATVKSSHDLDMSAFKSGIYFLKVKNSFGIQNLKIIKK
ncbi:family 16 glycosylhydrolase [Flavobacterium luteum]|uniref:Family 16 glycosylhydrolase n=1 Tax=Flavobacterium luteum TaxID=2026654 RepID=A0A7J5AB95_9FLAO|nr:family 16 glycosylhydrolase [Flavobacterium luteum]KAB1154842.1 family 16 glycosylhydrolase [Flavobacterium luteum]